VIAVVRDDLAAGFALTGMQVVRVREHSASATREALQGVLEDRESGLVIVDDGLLDVVDERLRAVMDASNVPLFIAVPGKLIWSDVEALSEDEHVAHLVRRAVGYQLKVQL
jgi:vacuolar-type H+-ATPase subunit F/Vma7